MAWPAEQEKQWQLFLSGLEASSHGFFLLAYDRLDTRDALLRRLRAEFKRRQRQLEETTLAGDHLETRLASALREWPVKAFVVTLDGATAQEFSALNLARETLYDLPTNIIFLTSQETHTRFLTSARDLVTWINIPYSFALPKTDIPKLPVPAANVSPTVADRIQYYREQIQHAVEQDNQQEAIRLLPSLADMYLDAAMYTAAYQIYQVLAIHCEQMADGRQAAVFTRRRDIAQGWRILADLAGPPDNYILLPEDRTALKQLLDEGILSIHKKLDGFAVVDERGHAMPISHPLLATLGALSERVTTATVMVPEEETDRIGNRARLRQMLDAHFSESELRDLCFDLNVDYESLLGQGKADKTRELVAHLERRGRIRELVAIASELRPNVSWQDAPEVTRKATGADTLTSLRQDIVDHLNEDELRDLCSIMGLDYNDFSESRKSDTVRKIVAYLEHRNRIPELADALTKRRPNVSWDAQSISARDKVTVDENVSVKIASASALHLQRMLMMARRTLAILEEQAAGYTALTIPVHLRIELEEKRRQVADLEAQLQGQ